MKKNILLAIIIFCSFCARAQTGDLEKLCKEELDRVIDSISVYKCGLIFLKHMKLDADLDFICCDDSIKRKIDKAYLFDKQLTEKLTDLLTRDSSDWVNYDHYCYLARLAALSGNKGIISLLKRKAKTKEYYSDFHYPLWYYLASSRVNPYFRKIKRRVSYSVVKSTARLYGDDDNEFEGCLWLIRHLLKDKTGMIMLIPYLKSDRYYQSRYHLANDCVIPNPSDTIPIIFDEELEELDPLIFYDNRNSYRPPQDDGKRYLWIAAYDLLAEYVEPDNKNYPPYKYWYLMTKADRKEIILWLKKNHKTLKMQTYINF